MSSEKKQKIATEIIGPTLAPELVRRERDMTSGKTEKKKFALPLEVMDEKAEARWERKIGGGKNKPAIEVATGEKGEEGWESNLRTRPLGVKGSPTTSPKAIASEAMHEHVSSPSQRLLEKLTRQDKREGRGACDDALGDEAKNIKRKGDIEEAKVEEFCIVEEPHPYLQGGRYSEESQNKKEGEEDSASFPMPFIDNSAPQQASTEDAPGAYRIHGVQGMAQRSEVAIRQTSEKLDDIVIPNAFPVLEPDVPRASVVLTDAEKGICCTWNLPCATKTVQIISRRRCFFLLGFLFLIFVVAIASICGSLLSSHPPPDPMPQAPTSPPPPDPRECWGKLVPSEYSLDSAWYGGSVDVDGDTAIVGASHPTDSACYVFSRSSETWDSKTKLIPSGRFGSASLANSVAISGDTVVVGAYTANENGDNAGAAYVFSRIWDNWAQRAKLQPGDPKENKLFGWDVAVSGDIALVGAIGDDANGEQSGAAYIFVRSHDGWSEHQKLVASDGKAFEKFGGRVAVHDVTILIGAYGGSTGAAYIFTRLKTGAWAEQKKIIPTDDFAYAFGISVALSNDTAIIGDYYDSEKGPNSGSATVFLRIGQDEWVHQAKLFASDANEGQQFGSSVSIDGSMAVVGAEMQLTGGNGNAYVFTRRGTMWMQTHKLAAYDATGSDMFGTSVAVSSNTVVVGASQNADRCINCGSAYFFDMECLDE